MAELNDEVAERVTAASTDDDLVADMHMDEDSLMDFFNRYIGITENSFNDPTKEVIKEDIINFLLNFHEFSASFVRDGEAPPLTGSATLLFGALLGMEITFLHWLMRGEQVSVTDGLDQLASYRNSLIGFISEAEKADKEKKEDADKTDKEEVSDNGDETNG